ncbi:MAG: hypothetical protein KDD56_01430 [Bdellovibrionales bacterium]|nr:hypothetical protein [Bdellovibrionales bacterium]
MHNLNEFEVNRLITSLHEISIDAEKIRQADGKWTLKVASSSKLDALNYLNQLRIFKRNNEIEISPPTVMSTREQQRFQYERSLSLSLENTLKTLDGVLDARVHLNLPVIDPLFGKITDQNENGTASILLIANLEFQNSEKEIASLLSGAAGIPINKISVLISGIKRSQFLKSEEAETISNLFTPLTDPIQKEILYTEISPDTFQTSKVKFAEKNKTRSVTQYIDFFVVILIIFFLILLVKVFSRNRKLKTRIKKAKAKNVLGVKQNDFKHVF